MEWRAFALQIGKHFWNIYSFFKQYFFLQHDILFEDWQCYYLDLSLIDDIDHPIILIDRDVDMYFQIKPDIQPTDSINSNHSVNRAINKRIIIIKKSTNIQQNIF